MCYYWLVSKNTRARSFCDLKLRCLLEIREVCQEPMRSDCGNIFGVLLINLLRSTELFTLFDYLWYSIAWASSSSPSLLKLSSWLMTVFKLFFSLCNSSLDFCYIVDRDGGSRPRETDLAIADLLFLFWVVGSWWAR